MAPEARAQIERMQKAFDRGASSNSQTAAAKASGQLADAASDSIND